MYRLNEGQQRIVNDAAAVAEKELAPRAAAVDRDAAFPRESIAALGAAGGEIVNGLREFARRRRIEIDAIEALVTGELEHALTYLEVVGEHETPRIARIHVKVFVSTPDEAAIRALFADMLERLPLACTLRAALDLKTELILTS